MLRLPLTYFSQKRPRVPAPAISLPHSVAPSRKLRVTLLALALSLAGVVGVRSHQMIEHQDHLEAKAALTKIHLPIPKAQAASQPQIQAEALAAQQAWLEAYEHRQAAITARQTILANRIATQYKIAPQAASFLVKEGERAAHDHHVNPVLLLAVVGVESRFNPYVISNAGAVGLTQMMPSAHPLKVKAVRDRGGSLINPADNLHVGAWILADYLRLRHGDQIQALQQYNGASHDKTAAYAKKVMRVYDRLNAHLPTIPDGPDGPPPSLASLAQA